MDNNGSHTSVKEKKSVTAGSGAEEMSCPVTGACSKVTWFVKDYIERHAHPVNATLHIFGVPAAFAGFFYLFSGKDIGKGAALIFIGYLFQYLGHKAQGNEVGEVTLIKKIYKKLKSRS